MYMKQNIRLAAISDSESILKIYEPYITDTAITFEIEVPSINEFSDRVKDIVKEYPFLVYEIDDKVVGYAYASKHRERAAYLYDVDVSIYILAEHHGSGIGYRLYECLFILLKELGYKNAYAAYTEPNIKSLKFHSKCGFTLIGTHHKTGYKLGQWHDVTWMEKTIGGHDDKPGKISAMSELSSEYLDHLFDCLNERRSENEKIH